MALTAIHSEDVEEEFVKPFTLRLQLLTVQNEIQTTALIDSGADCNVMSYAMWEKLGKPELTPSKLSFQSFSGLLTSSLGKIQIKARVQDQATYISFHVADKEQTATDLVLGRQWIGQTNFQINWATRKYTALIDSIELVGQSSELEDPPQPKQSQEDNSGSPIKLAQPSFAWIQDEENPTHGWKANMELLQVQGYKAQQSGRSKMIKCWVPRSSYQALPVQCQKAVNYRQKAQKKEATMVWRPKSSSPSTTQPNPSIKKKSNSSSSSILVKRQPLKPRWVPKTILHTQRFYKGNTMLWLPKQNQPGKISKNETHPVLDQTKPLKLDASKASAIQKEYPYTLTITQRAYNLQKLLFGKASLSINDLISKRT